MQERSQLEHAFRVAQPAGGDSAAGPYIYSVAEQRTKPISSSKSFLIDKRTRQRTGHLPIGGMLISAYEGLLDPTSSLAGLLARLLPLSGISDPGCTGIPHPSLAAHSSPVPNITVHLCACGNLGLESQTSHTNTIPRPRRTLTSPPQEKAHISTELPRGTCFLPR